MSISVTNAIPTEYVTPKLASASKFVLRKRQQTFDPTSSASVYTPVGEVGTDILEFEISSASEIAMFPESYIRFTLELGLVSGTFEDSIYKNGRTGTFKYGIPNDTLIQQTASHFWGRFGLSKNGIHSLFERIEVRATSSGILIAEARDYALQSAVEMSVFFSKDHIASMFPSLGSPATPNFTLQRNGYEVIFVPGTLTSAQNAAGSEFVVEERIQIAYLPVKENTPANQPGLLGSVLISCPTLYSMCQPEDIIMYDGTFFKVSYLESLGAVVCRRMTAVRDAHTTGVPQHFTNEVADSDNVFFPDKCLILRGHRDVQLQQLLETGKLTVVFKPILSLMNHNIPLNLMKGGLRFLLRLNRSECVFVQQPPDSNNSITSGNRNLTYKITNPKFIVTMSAPHQEIVDAYIAMWRSEEGLLFPIPMFNLQQFQTDINITRPFFTIQPGVRSAKQVYMVITDKNFTDRGDPNARYNDSYGTWLRSNLKRWSFAVGSETYPTRDIEFDRDGIPVDALAITNETMEQLRIVTGRNFVSSICSGMQNVWQGVRAISNRKGKGARSNIDARDFIVAVDLARHKGTDDTLTGVDLTNINLQFRAEKGEHTNTEGAPRYNFFIWHDAILKINSEGVGVLL